VFRHLRTKHSPPIAPKKSFPRKGNPGRLARTNILNPGCMRITSSDETELERCDISDGSVWKRMHAGLQNLSQKYISKQGNTLQQHEPLQITNVSQGMYWSHSDHVAVFVWSSRNVNPETLSIGKVIRSDKFERSNTFQIYFLQLKKHLSSSLGSKLCNKDSL